MLWPQALYFASYLLKGSVGDFHSKRAVFRFQSFQGSSTKV